MARADLTLRIGARAAQAALAVSEATLHQLSVYLELLGRWNERINLTAFALASPSDDAIDRLLIEPMVAARKVLPGDHLLIDIGSGGGSPAIPLRIAAPWLRLVMVESKSRKCAFLREAVRTLGLGNAEVENGRVEELAARRDLHGAADLVTVRAVRADAGLWAASLGFLRPGGRVLWFTTASGLAGGPVGETMTVVSSEALPSNEGGRLVVIRES